jgi:hypothetical protein
MKEKLKEKAYQNQNGKCALTSTPLKPVYELFDTHRPNPKANGGTYTDENTRVVNPVAHMQEHGNYKIREQLTNELKKLVDAREHAIRFKNKVENQLRAYRRQTDDLNEEVVNMLLEEGKKADKVKKSFDRQVEKKIKEIAKVDPVIASAGNVISVGYITLAYCHVYIDFKEARHPSSLWKYVGLHAPSHERYQKGQAGGGNKRLRSVLFTMADSQMKNKKKSAYGHVYEQVKTRLAQSEKITKSRNTKGQLIECKWKDTKPSHRHGAALRAVMKHFLADLWYVGRKLNGLETNPAYAEAQLGMSHKTINPKERGWEF